MKINFKKNIKSYALHILDFLLDLLIIFLIVWLLRTYFVSPFRVSGSSMESTLYDGDFLIVNKFMYLISEPQRGDVVVIKPPQDPDKFYVKRIIGIGGDTLRFVNGNVCVSNKELPKEVCLNEIYLNPENNHNTFVRGDIEKTFYIPQGKFFVMGDNRMHSTDSRSWASNNIVDNGAIPKENIIGYVWFVMYPNPRIIEHHRYKELNVYTNTGLSLLNY